MCQHRALKCTLVQRQGCGNNRHHEVIVAIHVTLGVAVKHEVHMHEQGVPMGSRTRCFPHVVDMREGFVRA
eukprot:5713582-Prorocentrum_lima.AAC.1